MPDEYHLTLTEYAKLCGISREGARTRRRTGKLEGQYILKEGKYLFKSPRPNQEKTTAKNHSKPRRRGAHYSGDTQYRSKALEQHNELKMLARLKHSVSEEDAALIPAAIHKIKQDRASTLVARSSKQVAGNYKNYGRGVYDCKKQQPQWVDLETYETNNLKPKKKFEYY